MSVLASSSQDRWLDLNEILRDLVTQEYLDQDNAEYALTLRRTAHASDIHIEISRNKSRIRLRIDGILYEVMSPRVELHPAIVSRLKVMAHLDIAERRLPQDGRIQVMTQGRTVDLRFSSLPGIYGEKVVLRVLDKNQSILDVDKLGMNGGAVDAFKRLLGRSHG
jgi:type IV pilus assembly protein PilB